MNIEFTQVEKAIINGLIASQLLRHETSLANCVNIENKDDQRSVKEFMKNQIKELEGILDKLDAVPDGCGEVQSNWQENIRRT